jgi:hypothetical protein
LEASTQAKTSSGLGVFSSSCMHGCRNLIYPVCRNGIECVTLVPSTIRSSVCAQGKGTAINQMTARNRKCAHDVAAGSGGCIWSRWQKGVLSTAKILSYVRKTMRVHAHILCVGAPGRAWSRVSAGDTRLAVRGRGHRRYFKVCLSKTIEEAVGSCI